MVAAHRKKSFSGKASLKRQKKTEARQQIVNQALELRLQDWSYKQIGEKFGVQTSIIATWIDRAIEAVPIEAVGKVRTIETAKLDQREQEVRFVRSEAMQTLLDVKEARELARKAVGEDRVALLAQAALLGANALNASKVILDADRTLGHIADRRAKLLGLDAPVVTEITGPGGTSLGPSPEEAARLVREAFKWDVKKVAVDAQIVQNEDGEPSNVHQLRPADRGDDELRAGAADAASPEAGDVPQEPTAE